MTPTPNTSKRARGLLGSGLAIIFCWYMVTFYPQVVGKWALTDKGKIVLDLLQGSLLFGTIAAIITIANIISANGAFKISKIKYKNFEIDFDKGEVTQSEDEQSNV